MAGYRLGLYVRRPYYPVKEQGDICKKQTHLLLMLAQYQDNAGKVLYPLMRFIPVGAGTCVND